MSSVNSEGIKDGKPIIGSLWVQPTADGTPGNLYRIEGDNKFDSNYTDLTLIMDLKKNRVVPGHGWRTSVLITDWELYSPPEDNTTKAIEERKNGCICVLGRSRFCTVHKE